MEQHGIVGTISLLRLRRLIGCKDIVYLVSFKYKVMTEWKYADGKYIARFIILKQE